MPRLSNQTVIVTGSTTGIGKAIAKHCLAEGANVMFHGLEPDLAAELQVTLAREYPGQEARWAMTLSDLEHEASCSALVAQTVARFGALSGLVNNAAYIPFTNLQTTDAELFLRAFRVNTLAPFLLIQAAVPHLEKNSGSVVNIGSVNSYCGEPNLLPYSISKGALMTLTRNLGDSLMQQHRVRVNQVNPGWILTENEQRRKQEHGLGADWEQDLPRVFAPAGRIFRPAEVAALVVFMLSADAGPFSGQVWDLEQYPMIGRNPPKNETTAVRPSAASDV
ncbi:MAG: SDR family oxidoreductase [Planctomycetaceae bacterium]|nr:SDR family oxidoreductase [Planctomycetaceae bacterium]